jgi:hypothetical protein
MKVAIMQPYFFPYLGYFQLINLVDKFIIYDDVNFIKGGWINRNRILINGEPRFINISLIGASSNKLIKDIALNENDRDFSKLKKTISLAYKKAPFYKIAFPVIEDALTYQDDISSFNTHIIKVICNYLGIKTKIIETSRGYKNSDLKSQERVIDICTQELGIHYINPSGGKKLYNYSLFEDHGIKLNFIETNLKPYNQFGNLFMPGLSIIDVMMFNPLDELERMLYQFKLV